VFNSVARLGFDDHAWFADPDLDIMITEGQKELAQLGIALADAQRAAQAKEASGETVPKQMLEQVEAKAKEVKEAEEQLAPYLAEKAKRAK
jgi:hypothetical protein